MCKFTSKILFKCGDRCGGVLKERCLRDRADSILGWGHECKDEQQTQQNNDDICPDCKNRIARSSDPGVMKYWLENDAKFNVLMDFWENVKAEYEKNGRQKFKLEDEPPAKQVKPLKVVGSEYPFPLRR